MFTPELRLQAEITRNMIEGVVLVRTSDWEIVYANESFERMFGYERGELLGRSVDNLNEPAGRDLVEVAAEIQAVLERDGCWSGEVQTVRKDGTPFWSEATVSNFDHPEHGQVSVAVHTDVTERRRTEEALRRRERQLGEAQAVAHIGNWEWDIAADEIEWSDELCRIFGVPVGDAPRTYEAYLERVHPEDREWVDGAIKDAYANCEAYHFEHRVLRSDGGVRMIDGRGHVVIDDEGGALRMFGTAQDITEMKRVEGARQEAEERFRRAFDDSATGMALVSVDPGDAGRVLEANDAICEITGYDREALLEMNLEVLTHHDDLAEIATALGALHAGETGKFQAEYRIMSGVGEEHWVALSTSLVRGASGEPIHRVVQLQDVSERKRFEGQLRYLADHDPLTGLFNRRRFEQELDRELATARRYGRGGALLIVDLDNFKYVNDSAGHAAGDELIRAIGCALKGKLRVTDRVARLGGDEFAVLLPQASEGDAVRVAEAILELIRTGVSLGAGVGPRRTSASIGVAPFGDLSRRTSADELLIEGDIAMYDAKEAGRDRISVYQPDRPRQDVLEQRLTWLDRIRRALAEDRFALHAQPIVPLGPGVAEVPRYELLLRMVGDDGDLIPPASFLDVAERFALVEEIDRWVVRAAIELVAAQGRSGHRFAVEVNLSGKSFGNAEVVDWIATELARTGADPTLLIFEVTETAAIEQVDRARQFVRSLQNLGCSFALDDFGSGFASFYYLKHLEFDYLKIDGEFIKNLPRSNTDQLVVRSLVSIAQGLGKKTIAEFVGDDETIALLRRLGVDYAQGYHLGRPAPLAEHEARVEAEALAPSV